MDDTPNHSGKNHESCNRRTRVAFLQKTLFDYRFAFYEGLNQHVEVTVAHPGYEPNCNINQIQDNQFAWLGLRWSRALTSLLNQNDVVVLSFDVHWIQLFFAPIWRNKTALIFWGHGVSKNGIANVAKSFLLRFSKALIVYTEQQKAACDRRFPKYSSKITVAKNTQYVDTRGKKYASHENRDSFLFIGRLTNRKNVDKLIAAYSEVQALVPRPLTLRIVGSGEAEPNLRRLTALFPFGSQIEFIPDCRDPDKIFQYYNRSFAYVSTGSLGLSAVQALAHAVPVIAPTNCRHGPEFGYLEDQKNSVLFDGSQEQLVQAMLNLVNSSETFTMLSRNAQRYYKDNLSINCMVDDFLQTIFSASR